MSGLDKQYQDFIEEQRAWLRQYKAETNASWSQLAAEVGRPQGTLSNFGGKGYAGNELEIAEAVLALRRSLDTRATTYVDAPEIPGYFETQTSAEIIGLLHYCQRGKMVYGALGSGIGKTTACRYFRSLYPNVYIVTFFPSEGAQGPMQVRVLSELGIENPSGQASTLSRMVCDRLKGMHRPVLILDEAQNLTIPALEEIRGWQDHVDVGIAFFGDKRLHDLIQHGSGKSDIPQFRRRIKAMPLRILPYESDVAALAKAWNVEDQRMIAELKKVCARPGALGLGTQALEYAGLLASDARKPMDISHLREAIKSMDPIRASVIQEKAA